MEKLIARSRSWLGIACLVNVVIWSAVNAFGLFAADDRHAGTYRPVFVVFPRQYLVGRVGLPSF